LTWSVSFYRRSRRFSYPGMTNDATAAAMHRAITPNETDRLNGAITPRLKADMKSTPMSANPIWPSSVVGIACALVLFTLSFYLRSRRAKRTHAERSS